jgi:hypothetical protein
MSGDKKAESAAVKAARERVEALKAQSNKLDDETAALAELARAEVAELKRLDREGDEAHVQRAYLAQSEAWSKLSPEQQRTTVVECVRDYPTHKRTGRGIIVVSALDRDATVKALKPAAKVGEGGLALYDNSEETVLNCLLKAVLWPDASTVQQICQESPGFAAAAYSTAVVLSGAFAKVASGKSES